MTMKTDEIEIITADVIILDYGHMCKFDERNYPEFEAFIWQPSIMKYKGIRPNEPISELSPDIVGEFIHQLFMLHAIKDYSIEHEISDRRDRSLKHTAYLHLKELKE